MGALPIQPIRTEKDPSNTGEDARATLPDYLPARMVNEFAYCPRLFFYEWVEGLFQERLRHRRRRHPAPARR